MTKRPLTHLLNFGLHVLGSTVLFLFGSTVLVQLLLGPIGLVPLLGSLLEEL